MLNKRGIRIDIFSWQMAVGLIGEEGGGGGGRGGCFSVVVLFFS